MTVHRVGSARVRHGSRRVGVVLGPAVVGALLLAACGGSDEGASATTLDLSQSSTAFVVRPPVTTVAPTDSVAAEGTTTGSQEYEVQAGDVPINVAKKFGVSLDDLIAFNEWASAAEFPFPGTVIQIPPGGTVAPSTTVAAGATGDTAAPDEGDTASTDPATSADTIPDAGDNCAEGSYTIAAGDIPLRVAEKFDVTVEALAASNASTSGYGSFYVGLEIVIPAKADCP
jgi:LysM repeat protein